MSDRDMNDLDKLKAYLVFPQMLSEIEDLMDEYETKSLNSKENTRKYPMHMFFLSF